MPALRVGAESKHGARLKEKGERRKEKDERHD
jgi:hypothetical protein